MSRFCSNHGIFAMLFFAITLTISLIFSPALPAGRAYLYAEAQTPEGQSSPKIENLQITRFNVGEAYEYEGGAVKILFPDGWTGIEVSEQNGATTVATVSPDTIVEPEDLVGADPIMSLVISQKVLVDMAPGTVPPLLSMVNSGDSLVCGVSSSEFILLNGVFSEEILSDCSVAGSQTGNNTVLRSVLTHTNEIWVALTLYGTPESVVVSEAQFESALSTLMVVGASDLRIPFTSFTFNTFNVNANGSRIPVDVKSTSPITDFELDEPNKRVSFIAEGINRKGVAEISIGRVLEGPYVVTVNGDVWDDYEVINGETSREDKIQIRYEEEGGDIVIRGTQVVPEFGLATMSQNAADSTLVIVLAGALVCLMMITRIGASLQRAYKR